MARPIIDAIRAGNVALAKKLLQTQKYSHIDCQTNKKDGSALFWASNRGLLELVEMLITHGASVFSQTGYGATPLHAAADANQSDVIRLLISYGANVNSTTGNGDTACHLAAYRGHGEAVQVLVECGANLNQLNNKCHRPLDEAESSGHLNIVRYLAAVSSICYSESTVSPSIMAVPGSPVSPVVPHRFPLRDCNSAPRLSPGYLPSPPRHSQHQPNPLTYAHQPRSNGGHDVNNLSMDSSSFDKSADVSFLNIPV